MKRRFLFVFHAIVSLGFGVAFILAPAKTLSFYGMTLNSAGIIMTQLFGVALIAVGLLAWLVRDASESDALRAIMLAFFASNSIGTVLGVRIMLAGEVAPLGWSTVGLYAILAAGYAYFRFGGRSA